MPQMILGQPDVMRPPQRTGPHPLGDRSFHPGPARIFLPELCALLPLAPREHGAMLGLGADRDRPARRVAARALCGTRAPPTLRRPKLDFADLILEAVYSRRPA